MNSRRTLLQDFITTLHIPRAIIFYCWVLIGTFLSPVVYYDRLILSLVATFFFLQISAYAIDELKGRHCSTKLSDFHLKFRAYLGLTIALIIGVYLGLTLGLELLLFMVIGVVVIAFYNFEVLGFHNRIVFAVMWGAYPILTNFYLHSFCIPFIEVGVISIFAGVFANMHIISYGNFFCGVETCKEYLEAKSKGIEDFDKECHGQVCFLRRTMGRRIHRLQKKIVNHQVWIVIFITIFIIILYYFS